jgi:hypothetical protein
MMGVKNINFLFDFESVDKKCGAKGEKDYDF